ncbi:MAG: hypothetical protein QM817_26695 [Archangium sp.]
MEKRAHQLTYELLEQQWTGAKFIAVPDAEPVAFHRAFVASWAAMLSAFSAGLAHADENDPKLPEREARLAQLKEIVIVAPGAAVPPDVQSIAFVSPTTVTR